MPQQAVVCPFQVGLLSDELRATVGEMEQLAGWWFDVGDPQPGG